MKFLKIILIITFFLFIQRHSHAQQVETKSHNVKKEIYTAYAKGNNKQLVNAIKNYILKFPESPDTIIFIHDLYSLQEVYGSNYILNILNTYLEKINTKSDLKSLQLQVIELIDKIEFNTRKINNSKFSKKYNPIRNWNLSGPFHKFGEADFNYPFLKSYPKKEKTIKIKNYAGICYLNRFMPISNNHNKTIYASTSILASKNINLRIESNTSYKLYLNNIKVIENTNNKVFRNKRIINIPKIVALNLKLKLLAKTNSYFRIIITDSKNNPINYKQIIKKKYSKNIKFKEIYDYPYYNLINQQNISEHEKSFMLGHYFSMLESKESLHYFEKAYKTNSSPLYTQIYAAELFREAKNDSSSPYSIKAWQLLNKLWTEKPLFIPAAYYKFKYLYRHDSIINTINYGEKLHKESPFHLPLLKSLLDIYQNNLFNKQLLTKISYAKKTFPNLLYSDYSLIDYYLNRNPLLALELSQKVLSRNRSYNIASFIVNILAKNNKQSEAIPLLDEFINDGSFNAMIQKVKLLIEIKNYKLAKNLLLKHLPIKIDAKIYYYLGLIEIKQNRNPDLYWSKLQNLFPVNEFPSNYLSYKKHSKFVSTFSPFRNKNLVNKIIANFVEKKQSFEETILYRAHYYRIYNNGSGHTFREELIHIKSEKDIDRYGEYKIPFGKKTKILKARVYHANGTFYNSYNFQNIDNNTYVTLPGLVKNSLIHITYEVPNSINRLPGSNIISTPLIKLQNYNESVSNCELKIITSNKDRINFYLNSNYSLITNKNLEHTTYEINFKNLKKKIYEKYSGYFSNNLLTYCFTTVQTNNEFVFWYKGKWPHENSSINFYTKLINKNDSKKEIISKVFKYVSQQIDKSGNLYFSPQSYEKTIQNKKGSIEDKVFLTKQILSKLKIKSFIALVKKSLPKNQNFVITNHTVKTILLYIPLNENESLWLDFSNKHFNTGTVRSSLNGLNAVILLKKNLVEEQIKSLKENFIQSKYNIKINEKGKTSFQIINSFYGSTKNICNYFIDNRYNEDIISSYYNNLQKNLIINNYNISDIYDLKNPFKITATGIIPGFSLLGLKSITFSPFLKNTLLINYIQSSSRKSLLVVKNTYSSEDNYVYVLPKTFRNKEINIQKQFKCLSGYANFTLQKKKGSLKLIAKQKIYFPKTKISTKDYSKFLDFCVQIRKTERLMISL